MRPGLAEGVWWCANVVIENFAVQLRRSGIGKVMMQLIDSMECCGGLRFLRLLVAGVSGNFRTNGSKSERNKSERGKSGSQSGNKRVNKSRINESIQISMVLGLLLSPLPARGEEDAVVRGVQQNQLQRQQQQEALRLRMQQQQGALQAAPADEGKRQALDQLRREQLQRQQQLHYRQAIEPAPAPAPDDAGARRAKAEMAREAAQRESEQQLQRLDDEAQRRK